jgi:hypothetical protein
MEGSELYKKIARELEEKLANNHVSTILHIEEIVSDDEKVQTKPQFLIVVKKFNKYTLMIIINIIRQHSSKIEMPFVVEYNDIHGMLDSIPRSFLKIKMDYKVLAGQDIIEMVKPPSYEHFRSQTELTLRNDIFNLRRDLFRVMTQKLNSQDYLKELSIVALNSIRNYYQITKPKLKTTKDFIMTFNKDFPDGKSVLQRLLSYTYSMIKGMEISEEDRLQLILSTLDNVLQPILIEIDSLGLEFERTLAKESKKLSYKDFIQKYEPEIQQLRAALIHEAEIENRKREHVLRGELELKFREREKKIIQAYSEEINKKTDKYETQLDKLNDTFDDQLEKRTSEFISKKLEEEQAKLQSDYEDKLKNMRDELELKYITTDLREKEEQLRKEYNAYEKSLRKSFDVREKALRDEINIKKKNFKESLELEYKAKLDGNLDNIRHDLEIEFDESLDRMRRKEQRRYETEMKRRENKLEKQLKSEFTRREKDLTRQFKREVQSKESELKSKLLLDFEREKLKLESKKSEAYLNLIDKELALKFKELEKFQNDLLRSRVLQETYIQTEQAMPQTPAPTTGRSFIRPPEADESGEEGDLFMKILNDNRVLKGGLPKKDVKKVS